MDSLYRLQARSPGLQRYCFLAFALLCAFVLYRYVDLTPKVESDFFFSSDDPQLQDDKKIDRMFIQNSQVIISVATSDITAPDYGARIQAFALELMELQDVHSVKDIRHGPDNIEDALESPLWRRLLISEDGRSTFIIMTLRGRNYARAVPQIERLIAKYDQPDFRIAISGVPYVVEQIKRSALQDLRVFSGVSVAFFAAVILIVYRSARILLGIMLTCLTAAMLTLILQDFLRLEPGVLIANVGTLVFVMTLSHTVYITANWKEAALRGATGADLIREACQLTDRGSFWSMVTALLGFGSFLFAPAKPIRQFGLCTSVGAIIAMACAYVIYPAFLRAVALPRRKAAAERSWIDAFLSRRHVSVTGVVMVLFVAALPAVFTMDTDPSLLSYFKKGSEIRQGLERIDRNGGSSPLDIVVRDRDKERLNDEEAYERLWAMQRDLERDASVGTILSLPVIWAEADRAPLSFLITWEGLLKRLEDPKVERVGSAFITKDRVYSRFVLRMKEEGRTEPRAEVIDRLHGTIRKHGFAPVLTGRLYILQNKLNALVASSLLYGLIGVVGAFWLITLHISHSLRASLAILAFLAISSIGVVGLTGYLGVSPDIISSPAAGVTAAMGIDASFHMLYSARGKKRKVPADWAAWVRARKELWRPILAESSVVAAGASVFMLSQFPPTQRFGFLITVGTLLAVVLIVLVVPVLAAAPRMKRSRSEKLKPRGEETSVWQQQPASDAAKTRDWPQGLS